MRTMLGTCNTLPPLCQRLARRAAAPYDGEDGRVRLPHRERGTLPDHLRRDPRVGPHSLPPVHGAGAVSPGSWLLQRAVARDWAFRGLPHQPRAEPALWRDDG